MKRSVCFVFFFLGVLIALNSLQITDAVVLSRCQSTKNVQSCQCQGTTISGMSNGCVCMSNGYFATTMSCIDDNPPITCASQCGNGAVAENTATPYMFQIFQRGLTSANACPTCNADAGSSTKTCYEVCDTGPGTMGLYVSGTATTCCPRNCGWNGRDTNVSGFLPLGTPVRQLNGVFDRFNIVPKQCYTIADCDTATGWTVSCEYNNNFGPFGWCKYLPQAGTLPAASNTPVCPTLPCYTTGKFGSSCLITGVSNNINTVYNGIAGYYPDTRESGYYCQKTSTVCWNTPSCINGALVATPVLPTITFTSAQVSVQCNTDMALGTFLNSPLILNPSTISIVMSSFVVTSTTCPVNVSISNGRIYFSGLGSSPSCTVFMTFNTTCFQRQLVTKSVVLSCCGDGTVTTDEVCDTGLYVGYLANTTCCLGCTAQNNNTLSPPLITAKTCTTNANCVDNSNSTTDTCVNGWCSNKISLVQSFPSSTLCSSNPCTIADVPCYTHTCTQGSGTINTTCTYGIPTDNIASLSLTAYKNETVCRHTISCVNATSSVAYRTYLTPTFTLTPLTIPSQRCNTNISLPISSIVQTTWTSVSSYWGTPAITYQLAQVGTCALTATITGGISPSVAFSGSWNSSLTSSCQFNYTGFSACGDSKTVVISIPIQCCGDGITQPGNEQCDIGVLNGKYGYCCSSTCQYTPGVQCGNSSGLCDGGAFCLTGSTTCPAHTPLSSLVQCFTAYNDCTLNRTCDGVSLTCPCEFKSLGSSCNLDDNLCTQDACNGNGTCILGSLLSYDDGQFCNGPEGCDGSTGLMIPGVPPNCSDSNSCTIDTCDETLKTCTHTPVANSTGQCGVSNVGSCQYGNYVCDGSGETPVITCVGAVYPSTEICVPGLYDENCNGLIDEGCDTIPCISDLNCSSVQVSQCQESFCNASNVCDIRPKASNSSCNDGLACTINDICDGDGGCAGTPVICSNNGNNCVLPYCTEPFGTCQYNLAYYAGSSCTCDPFSCLEGCTCNTQGQCAGGTQVSCPPTNNQCTASFCDVSLNGTCNTQNILGVCNDGLDCTYNDQCINGVCAGIHINVDDGVSCTIDSCIEPGGLASHVLMSGYCFIDSICYSSGTVNPSNPCQLCNSSISTSQWSFTQVLNVSCNDGLRCTTDDTCQLDSQTCQGTPIDCSSLSNDCNTASCSETTGTCILAPVVDGQPCTSLNFCTENKQCQTGVCTGGVPRDCHIFDSQCTLGVCNDTASECLAIPLPDYTQCILDTDLCNGQEFCLTGDCVYGDPPVIPESGECYHYICDPLMGVVRVSEEGQPCSDSNACTSNDTCTYDGFCDPGSPISCDDNDPCTDDMCNATAGCAHIPIENCQACISDLDCSFQTCHYATCNAQNQCEYSILPAGSCCGNEDRCDGRETCSETGTCLSGIPLNCNSTNPCMDGFCNATAGCYYVPNPNNTFSMENPCLVNERCSVDGVPLYDNYQCPPSDVCNTYTCQNIDNQAVCVVTINTGASCNDNDDCTENDACTIFGNCQGTPIECPLPNQCEISVDCDGGSCVHIYEEYGFPCDNGNLCYQNICDGNGGCINGDPIVTCDPIDDCHGPGVCIGSTGTCTTPLLADGTSCPSTNPCVLSSECQQGNCNPAELVQCPSTDQCELNGVCNTTTGSCENNPVPDNTPCDSGNACASLSVCINKQCTDTDFINCNSTDPCIDSYCDTELGCVVTFNQDPCDNSNLCLENYHCVDGSCPESSGTPVDCNDGNPCTQDECFPQLGCVHSQITDCYSCTINGTDFAGAPECPPLPCEKAFCGSNNICYYVVDDTNVIGCVDDIFCNGQESCSSGQCIHGTPPSCDDSNGCTIDSCDVGSDQCQNTPNIGQECGLSDLCVYSAQCNNQGLCEPAGIVTCPPPTDQCQVLLGCVNDQCTYDDAPNGSPCVPLDPCAISGECQRGICEVTSVKPCYALDQCHLPGTCDSLTGNCSNPQKEDYTPCDDGYDCSVGDQCISGGCVPGSTDYCNNVVIDEQCQMLVCSESPDGPQCLVYDMDGIPCDDGIPFGVCTKQTICSGGQCVREYKTGDVCRAVRDDCDIQELCGFTDDCPPDQLRVNGHPCPDNLYCHDSTCQDGACIPTVVVPVPPPASQCTMFVCDESQPAFVQVNMADGTLCNTETTGQCVDHHECLAGACILIPKPNTTSCCDGNNCTIGDKCSGTSDVCISGGPKDCSSLNTQCSTGVCMAPSGVCSTQAANEGGSCNADNNPCTPLDVCRNQSCVAGDIKNCTYLNSPCSIGLCRILNTTYGECYSSPTGDACNPDSCTGGCVLTHGYWSTHNSQEKSPSQRIPWPFNSESIVLCGHTWYYWSQQKSSANAWIKLFDQWLAATLNRYIGACMPQSIQTHYNLATTLLSQCNTGILTSSLASSNYKTYAAALEAYDSGTISPQSCTTKYLTGTLNARDTIPDIEGVDTTYPLDSLFENIVLPEFCINGDYDFITSICNCYYGWGSPTCGECGIPDQENNTFLCVPTTTGNPPYLLQSISNDKVEQYLTKSLPILQLSSLDPVYPNTNGLDCSCGPDNSDNVNARDLILNIYTSQDTSVIITTLQEEFGECQTIFNTDITIIHDNNCTDSNGTVVVYNETIVYIDIETSDDDDDDDDIDLDISDNLWWIILLGVFAALLVVIVCYYMMRRPNEVQIIGQSLSNTKKTLSYDVYSSGMHSGTRDYDEFHAKDY